MASWLVEWKNATETQWFNDFPDSKSGDRMMHSATRRALSSIRKTAVFFCRNWAGCATGIAVRSRVL